jgi:GTPase SAR1 family protein
MLHGALLGDAAIGQASLLVTSATDAFPTHFIPKSFDNFVSELAIGSRRVTFLVSDTRCHHTPQNMRRASLPIHVFIVCFSLVSPTSLENVQSKWIPMIKAARPTPPHILVGLKSDLRDEFCNHPAEFKTQGMDPIATVTGEEVKRIVERALVRGMLGTDAIQS